MTCCSVLWDIKKPNRVIKLNLGQNVFSLIVFHDLLAVQVFIYRQFFTAFCPRLCEVWRGQPVTIVKKGRRNTEQSSLPNIHSFHSGSCWTWPVKVQQHHLGLELLLFTFGFPRLSIFQNHRQIASINPPLCVQTISIWTTNSPFCETSLWTPPCARAATEPGTVRSDCLVLPVATAEMDR